MRTLLTLHRAGDAVLPEFVRLERSALKGLV